MYTKCVRILCSFALRIRRIVSRLEEADVNRLWRKLWNWYYCIIVVVALACLWATYMIFSFNLGFASNINRNWKYGNANLVLLASERWLSMVCGMREMAFKILRYIALYVLHFSYFLLTLSASFQFSVCSIFCCCWCCCCPCLLDLKSITNKM